MMSNFFKLLSILLLSLLLFTNCSEDADESKAWRMDVPTIDEFQLNDNEKKTNVHINDWGLVFLKSAVENSDNNTYDNGKPSENITVSPLSASMALAMLANTCDDTTEKAILSILGESNIEDLNTTVNKLMRFLPSEKNNTEIYIANSIWYHNTLTPDELWKKNLKESLYSLVSPLNFNDLGSVDIINSWCSANTNNMIPEIIDNIDASTKIILINALYFAGEWATKFSKSKTTTDTFKGRSGDSEVQMMHLSEKLQYKNFDNFQAIKLPFKGNGQMILMLPAEDFSPEEVIREIDSSIVGDNFPGLTMITEDGIEREFEYQVELSLPKFQVSSSIDITSSLEYLGLPISGGLDKMGIEELFGISAKQKMSTLVDEDGAKVAAVTVLKGQMALLDQAGELNVEVTFDRPFIYFIRNTVTGSILMAGIVNNL